MIWVRCSLTCSSMGMLMGLLVRSRWMARVWRTVLRFFVRLLEGRVVDIDFYYAGGLQLKPGKQALTLNL